MGNKRKGYEIMNDKIKYPMNFEEFIRKVTFLFLNNGFGYIE